jgi:hypothetical protein
VVLNRLLSLTAVVALAATPVGARRPSPGELAVVSGGSLVLFDRDGSTHVLAGQASKQLRIFSTYSDLIGFSVAPSGAALTVSYREGAPHRRARHQPGGRCSRWCP